MKPKSNHTGDQYTPQGIDACQTPAYALSPLLPHLDLSWRIWEPAAGEGYLAGALSVAGYDCVAGDILRGQNFFQYQPDRWTAIVTNPPYSIKFKWLARCYELAKPFALLMPVETIGAKSAQILFRKFGAEIIWLDKRVNFKMPNKGWEGSSAQFPTAWFTWGLNIGRENTFAQLVPSSMLQPELL